MRAPNGNRPKILVVEDEQVTALDLQRSLTGLGYEVTAVTHSGQKALQLTEQFCPDLVLMDIQLKGTVDGISAANQIRDRWQIPVVFVTANANNETLARAQATGAYGYLVKPFRPRELNATILVALHQHRLARELFAESSWLMTILKSLSDGVIATDAEGRVRYLNPVAGRQWVKRSRKFLRKPRWEASRSSNASYGRRWLRRRRWTSNNFSCTPSKAAQCPSRMPPRRF